MFRQTRMQLFLFMILLTLMIVPAAFAQEGTTVDILNVRGGPNANTPVLTQIGARVGVIIEGRNNIGDWILIHSTDNTIRGWVASRYVSFGEGVVLEYLPVTEEQIAGAPAPAPAASETNTNSAPAPAAPVGGSAGTGTTIDMLNVRAAPGGQVLAQIGGRANVIIEGRNNIGDWILIRSTDNTIRGWVASRYVSFGEGVALEYLPVTEEQVGMAAPAPAAPAVESNPAPAAPAANGESGVTGTMLSLVNVRKGAGGEYDVLDQLQINNIVVVEGRNQVGDWVIVHAPDYRVRGWVASRYVNFGGNFDLGTLPIINEIVGEATLPPDAQLFGLPTESVQQMYDRLWDTPVLHNIVNSEVVRIFRTGQALGNRPQVFMLMGDSVTAKQPFLKGFGSGSYALGPYSNLQETINYFSSVSPRANVANSFVNQSMAAQSGFSSASMFDGMWVDPTICNEAALYCEYNRIKPSVAIILFGPVDLRVNDPYLFQANMYRMVKDLKDRGVIPVLNTFANHPDFNYEEGLLFNTIILNAAEENNIPLINLWRATQELPDYGINVSDPIHLTQGQTFYDFNGEENLYGVTLRNLITLQALEELRREVLTK